MKPRLLDDCFLHDKDRLLHEEALSLLEQRISPIVETEFVPLEKAGGRILMEDILAPRPVPWHTNAAVDGYAFAHAHYNMDEGTSFEQSARIAAGHTIEGEISETGTARIFTGAAMPDIYDTVVMQEDITTKSRNGTTIINVPAGLKKGANCRLAGEDLQSGDVVLRAGTRLRPQELAGIASTGLNKIPCAKRLRVAVFSTGDELVQPGEKIDHGQVYDSNAPMLRGLIESTGADCIDLGVLRDDADIVRQSLLEASKDYDLLLTSGGASRGEEDHVVETLNELGQLHMWQIAVKPGRPMSFGQIEGCAFAGLPGNPVAVFVCFLLYVRPIILRLSGGRWPEPNRYRIAAGFQIDKKKTGRREFLRGATELDEKGNLRVQKFPRDGSGLISSLQFADGLIELDEGISEVHIGDPVKFIPFSEFGLVG